MSETLFIDKRKIIRTENEYDRFYNKGIELLQKYCGDIWTDFNLHDPGITILEQLCYALTELYYKSTFSIEDYFCDNSNTIPFDNLGLLRPEQCIPNGCITINDFRKVIFDDIPEVGNIWLEIDQNDIPGLYTIYVDIADHILLTDYIKQKVSDQIQMAFIKRRNLGEDISRIIILKREYCDLCGEIEIRSKRLPDELYGEIYYVCSQYVASNMSYRSVKELHLQGMTLPELLDGPLLKNGIILDSDLTERSRIISIPEMSARIREIDGVVDVHSLFLRCNGVTINGETPYSEGDSVKAIQLPVNNSTLCLSLESSGRTIIADCVNINNEAQKRLVCDAIFPDYIKDIKNIYPCPNGTYQEFNNYYSIQNHFPTVYGISSDGLPGSETPSRKAKAKQLKVYLYFFEQLMANFLESIQNIPKLFSPDPTLKQTYFFKHLDNNNIPDIEELYTDKDQFHVYMENTLAKHDNFISRRSEILDFLLSIYGLEFKQLSLRHFLKRDTSGSPQQKILSNKIRYLHYASLITSRLYKGLNYSSTTTCPDTMSGIEFHTQLRIGNDPENPDPTERMLIIEHILLRPFAIVPNKKAHWFYQFRISVVFPRERGRFKNKQFRTLVMQIMEKYAPAHLFLEYIWCSSEQWECIEPIYIKWVDSLANKQKNHDHLSINLSKLIVEYGKSNGKVPPSVPPESKK